MVNAISPTLSLLQCAVIAQASVDLVGPQAPYAVIGEYPSGLFVRLTVGSDLVETARAVAQGGVAFPNRRIVLVANDRPFIVTARLKEQLQQLAEENALTIGLRIVNDPWAFEFEPRDRVEAQLRQGPLAAMGFGMQLTMGYRLEIKIALPMPPTHWNPVDVFKEGGADPVYLQRVQLPVEGLPIEERLSVIDTANEVFRFLYKIEETDEGERFYKIPLLRDRNIKIEDIRIRISRAEYERARIIFEGAGGLQRIVRAVPYGLIRKTILQYLDSQGIRFEDILLVGIDRGGRIPALLTREALGVNRVLFLKVDQGGGGVGGRLDETRLARFGGHHSFRGKYLVFIDSTVDSGRQIQILKRYFDDPVRQTQWGHKGWIVVGSNEDGKTLSHHLNINWGVDPDITFEDNVELLGMDYEADMSNVRAEPSETSTTIRRTFREVSLGVGLDISPGAIKNITTARRAMSTAEKAVETRLWQTEHGLEAETGKPDLKVPDVDIGSPVEPVRPSKRLAVIGSGRDTSDLTDQEAKFIALSCSPTFIFNFGTEEGLPGMVLNTLADEVPSSQFRVFRPKEEDKEDEGERETVRGRPVFYTGTTDDDKRFNLIMNSDAVLVLAGGEGTLMEALIALKAGKPVVIVRDYGVVARYLQKNPTLKRLPNLHITASLPEAVAKLLMKDLGGNRVRARPAPAS